VFRKLVFGLSRAMPKSASDFVVGATVGHVAA
jgi:hypothetical protein